MKFYSPFSLTEPFSRGEQTVRPSAPRASRQYQKMEEMVVVAAGTLDDAVQAHMAVAEFVQGIPAEEAERNFRTEFLKRCDYSTRVASSVIYVAFAGPKPVGYVVAYNRSMNTETPELYIWMAGVFSFGYF